MLATLLAEFWPYAIGAVALVTALFGWGRGQKLRGRAEIIHKAKERDHDNAAEIRSRVERDLPSRVREFDDAGYRD